MKIGVTEGAVVKRLKRPLLIKGQYLRIAASRKQKRWGLGRYYLLDANGVVDKDVNIEQLARQLGVALPAVSLRQAAADYRRSEPRQIPSRSAVPIKEACGLEEARQISRRR